MIRTATAEDAAQVIEIQKSVQNFSCRREKVIAAIAMIENERETFLVAEVDGELISIPTVASINKIVATLDDTKFPPNNAMNISQ